MGAWLGKERGRKSDLFRTALSLQAWCEDRRGRGPASGKLTSGEQSGARCWVEKWVEEPLLVCSRMGTGGARRHSLKSDAPVLILAPPFTGCVTWSQSLHISEPQSHTYEMDLITTTMLRLFMII